ncbi:hypothetical protein V1511DRAFT_498405 [Dipodascopsis uninucleata]
MPRQSPNIPSAAVLKQLFKQQKGGAPALPKRQLKHEIRNQMLQERPKIEPVYTKHFRLGHKEVYFPNKPVILMQPFSSNYNPYKATFMVPSAFNKFDLRDYLYNIYGLAVKKVTSNLKFNKYEYQTYKYMTVEMDEPFVYPDTPQDLSPWKIDSERERLLYGEEVRRNYGGSSPSNKTFTAYEGLGQPDFPTIKPFMPANDSKALKRRARLVESTFDMEGQD